MDLIGEPFIYANGEQAKVMDGEVVLVTNVKDLNPAEVSQHDNLGDQVKSSNAH